jgi:hypothetical protein
LVPLPCGSAGEYEVAGSSRAKEPLPGFSDKSLRSNDGNREGH